MKFDIPGRKGPAKVVLHPNGRERVFEMPYSTNDPAEIKLLSAYPLCKPVPEAPRVPVAPPPPVEPAEEKKPPRSEKEA